MKSCSRHDKTSKSLSLTDNPQGLATLIHIDILEYKKFQIGHIDSLVNVQKVKAVVNLPHPLSRIGINAI